MRRAALCLLVLGALAGWLWQARLPPASSTPSARSEFSAEQIARARAYRDPTYPLAVAGLLVPVAAAALLAARGGARLAAGRRPALAAGLAAGLCLLLADATGLPLSFVAHVRARDAGLDLRSDLGWARDALLGLLPLPVLTGLVYAAGIVVVRRLRRPWLAAGALAWAAVALYVAVQPLAIDPLFEPTRPLRAPAVRSLLTTLETRLDAHPPSVRVGQASARTTVENAEVDGLGPTVRLVLDDTSLRNMDRAELRALLAHELAHVARLHTLKGVLWFGVLALPALGLGGLAAGALARRRGLEAGIADPRAAPVTVAVLLALSTLLLPVENTISRRYEAEADWVGLHATRDPAGMVALQRRLALAGLANPEPPRWAVWLLFDHPPVMERIGAARAFEAAATRPRAAPAEARPRTPAGS